jgi:hypothetical protein
MIQLIVLVVVFIHFQNLSEWQAVTILFTDWKTRRWRVLVNFRRCRIVSIIAKNCFLSWSRDSELTAADDLILALFWEKTESTKTDPKKLVSQEKIFIQIWLLLMSGVSQYLRFFWKRLNLVSRSLTIFVECSLLIDGFFYGRVKNLLILWSLSLTYVPIFKNFLWFLHGMMVASIWWGFQSCSIWWVHHERSRVGSQIFVSIVKSREEWGIGDVLLTPCAPCGGSKQLLVFIIWSYYGPR